LPPPQKQESKRIQINHSQELLPQPSLHPQPLLPPKMLPKPHPPPLPPQKQDNRRIQMIQLHPPPLPPKIELLPHPQFEAVKSLMIEPPSF
jgi:hypothetical protein